MVAAIVISLEYMIRQSRQIAICKFTYYNIGRLFEIQILHFVSGRHRLDEIVKILTVVKQIRQFFRSLTCEFHMKEAENRSQNEIITTSHTPKCILCKGNCPKLRSSRLKRIHRLFKCRIKKCLCFLSLFIHSIRQFKRKSRCFCVVYQGTASVSLVFLLCASLIIRCHCTRRRRHPKAVFQY